jgi:hypothetical protein
LITQLAPYQLATGSGAGLTELNASALTTGTLPAARIAAGSLPLASLANDPLARANHTGTQAWTTISGKPTTLAGYGINNAVEKNTSGDVTVSGSTTLQGAATLQSTTVLNGSTTLNGAVIFNTPAPVTGLRVAPAGDIPMITITP